LASGSSGNCTYVASDRTRILIDAGLSGKQTATRLAVLETDVADLNAVCLTHEHDDHKASVGILHRKAGVALYANAGTMEAVTRDARLAALPWNVFSTGSAFEVGDLQLEPFSVPHDSYDPVGFVVCCNGARAGVVTDMGMATTVVRERLRRCQVVVIESNHDEQMLRDAQRPWSLKQRIAGRQGHLSNQQAGELLADIAGDGLRVAFLAHLSSDCNSPTLAVKTVKRVLVEAGHPEVDVRLTFADRPTELVECGGGQ
jgi:phosphoribosyl 1,2-cyclic phosphodiesterase